jgi:uncharacterized membrane protein
MTRPLERAIEAALTAGLIASAVFLLAGLVTGRPGALRTGLMLLMLTPVVRVVILTVGLLVRRDWLFALVSLFVMGVLLSGMVVALNLSGEIQAPRAVP